MRNPRPEITALIDDLLSQPYSPESLRELAHLSILEDPESYLDPAAPAYLQQYAREVLAKEATDAKI